MEADVVIVLETAATTTASAPTPVPTYAAYDVVTRNTILSTLDV